MTEPDESQAEPATVTDERRALESPTHGGSQNRSSLILVWVGIAAGVVFIVAVVFFSGLFIGRSSSGNFRGEYHQPGMMWPSQSGQYGQWPGMMGPGGMMGPNWPGEPTTTAPTNTPRP